MAEVKSFYISVTDKAKLDAGHLVKVIEENRFYEISKFYNAYWWCERRPNGNMIYGRFGKARIYISPALV